MPKFPTDIAINQSALNPGSSLAASAQADAEKLNSLKGRKTDSPESVEKATTGFEALLLQQMMKSMFETVNRGDLLGEDSNEADIMRGMFTQAVADEIASGKGIGVKEVIRREVMKKESGRVKAEDL